MDDRLRETLSAMMDDEADELSVRRLLSHESQDDVRAQLQRWQQVRDLMQRGHSPVDSVDVSDGVRAVIEGQERPSVVQVDSQEAIRWRWPAVAMAVVALLVGFGAGSSWNSTPVSELAQPAQASATEAPVPELVMQGMSDEQRRQLNRYLLQHAQHNSAGAGHGSMGYARAVSVSGAGYQ